MTAYTTQLAEPSRTTYPSDDLKVWASESLGQKRCSEAYLKALAIVLGNMARADVHGARLILKTIVPWATRGIMRTLLEQLCEAGWITRWSDPKKATYAYMGRTREGPRKDSAEEYARIQREAEEADFRRYLSALGLEAGDCSY